MNEQRSVAASMGRCDDVQAVGPSIAAAPHVHFAGTGLRVASPSRMVPSHLEPKRLGIVVALLAPSFAAAESANGAGFLWAAILVLAGPALGGLAVCGAMIGWRWTTSKAPWAIELMASWRWSNRAKVFARADIASVLVPLVDHVGLQGRGTIQIVGSDGGYLTGAKKQGLTDAIRKWVEAGHIVRYMLLAPSKEAVAELEALRKQISRTDDTASERFEVLHLGGRAPSAGASPMSTPADIQLLERILHSCHPTLIWSADGVRKAMWIEGNHPPGENVSYNNQWVPPAAMGHAVPDLPNQTWSDVFSAWDGKLGHLREYSRRQMAIQ